MTMPPPRPDDDALLDRLQCETFEYVLKEVTPLNGPIADTSRDGWPASIAATGLALASSPVGVERGHMTRDAAVTITLTTLRFFRDSGQGTAPNATGYKGFLLAGALTAAAYFERDTQDEDQIRTSEASRMATCATKGSTTSRTAVAPPTCSAVASLPFAPEIVFPAIRYFTDHVTLEQPDSYGFKATFNPTFPVASANDHGWVSPWTFGLNQGPIVLMIENQRTGLIWRLMRQCPYIVQGLRRAGFQGGWL